jgi:hypothetical protein
MLMASLMVRVKCAVREVEILNTGGRCGAIVLFCFWLSPFPGFA